MERNRPIDRIKEMIQWLIDHKVIKSVSSFEKICSLSRRYVRNLYMTEKGNPGIEIVAQIYEMFPYLNLEWMVTGKGDMWKIKGTDEEVAKKIKMQLFDKIVLLI